MANVAKSQDICIAGEHVKNPVQVQRQPLEHVLFLHPFDFASDAVPTAQFDEHQRPDYWCKINTRSFVTSIVYCAIDNKQAAR